MRRIAYFRYADVAEGGVRGSRGSREAMRRIA